MVDAPRNQTSWFDFEYGHFTSYCTSLQQAESWRSAPINVGDSFCLFFSLFMHATVNSTIANPTGKANLLQHTGGSAAYSVPAMLKKQALY